MNKDDAATLQAAYEDMLATVTVLQAQIAALVIASPHRPALLHFYTRRMEHQLARGLGSPVSDSFLRRLESAHQTALQEMSASPERCDGTRPQ